MICQPSLRLTATFASRPPSAPSSAPSPALIQFPTKTQRPSHLPTIYPTASPTTPSPTTTASTPSSYPTQSLSSKPSTTELFSTPPNEPSLAPTTAALTLTIPVEVFGLALHSPVQGDLDEKELHGIIAQFLWIRLRNELPVKFELYHLDLELSLVALPEAIRQLNEMDETDDMKTYEFLVAGSASFLGTLTPSPTEIMDIILLSFECNTMEVLSELNDAINPVLKSTEEVNTFTLRKSASAFVVQDGVNQDEPSWSKYYLFVLLLMPAVALVAARNMRRRVLREETIDYRNTRERVSSDIEIDVSCVFKEQSFQQLPTILSWEPT